MTEGLAEVWALQVLAEINPDQGYSLPREHFLKFVWSLRLAQSRNSEPNAPQAKFTHHTHTDTHTHTSKHSSNAISRKDNDLSACPRALPAEVPWGTRVWQTRHIPGFPQCSQVASSSTRQRGTAGTGCSLARVGGCSSSLREETGTPSPPPAHSTKAREQAVAAS